MDIRYSGVHFSFILKSNIMTINNSVRLTGNIGKTPVLKTSKSGVTWTRFDIATHDYYLDAKGIKQTKTDWHTLVAFGKNAENICKYMSTGDKIMIEGKLVTSTTTTEENKVYKNTDIQIREFQMLNAQNK
jgi:single-strand DNA-binding protein